MTNEEIADEFLKNLDECKTKDMMEEAFLTGLKAGLKALWHDLRKDPNDLPDNHRYVWTNVGPGHHANSDWWSPFGRLQNVVAWCEPKFKEE